MRYPLLNATISESADPSLRGAGGGSPSGGETCDFRLIAHINGDHYAIVTKVTHSIISGGKIVDGKEI